MDKTNQTNPKKMEVAEAVRQACIEAALDSFRDASMSGLCAEGAMEAAVGAMQSLDLEQLFKKE